MTTSKTVKLAEGVSPRDYQGMLQWSLFDLFLHIAQIGAIVMSATKPKLSKHTNFRLSPNKTFAVARNKEMSKVEWIHLFDAAFWQVFLSEKCKFANEQLEIAFVIMRFNGLVGLYTCHSQLCDWRLRSLTSRAPADQKKLPFTAVCCLASCTLPEKKTKKQILRSAVFLCIA